MNRRTDPTDWMWAHACELLDARGTSAAAGRRIALPAGAFESVTRELTHGCLVVRLGKVN